MPAGLFRGKREALASALTNRLTKIAFRELSGAEWADIVAKQLSLGGVLDPSAKEIAGAMVAIHQAVMAIVTSQSFPEVGCSERTRQAREPGLSSSSVASGHALLMHACCSYSDCGQYLMTQRD